MGSGYIANKTNEWLYIRSVLSQYSYNSIN